MVIKRKPAFILAATALAAAPLAACTPPGVPAPQCDFYVSWTGTPHVANYTAACIGGTPDWDVPGFATGFQVAFTSAPILLTANWQGWGTPNWYNPGFAPYVSHDDYLTCMPHQTLWYRPVLGTQILNGVPYHVSSYGSPIRVTCGDGVWAGPVKPVKVSSVKLSR